MDEPEHDELVERFFQFGGNPVEEDDDWDYMVETYLKNGDVVLQQQILSGKNAEKLQEIENQEAFDPVNNTWPTENPNPDHGCDCQIHADTSGSPGPTLIHQATPNFTMDESATEPKRNSFSLGIQLDNPNKFNFEECSMEWKESGLLKEESFNEPSSVVGNVNYFPEEKSMLIDLNGKTYPYYNIEYPQFDAFKGATSKGSAYNRMFKGQTQYFSPRNYSPMSNQEALNKAILFREAIVGENDNDFHWIDEAGIKEMIMEGKKKNGKYILIKAAEAAITDHRSEGEEFQRIITPEILKKLTYTAIKKGADINHIIPKRNKFSGVVIDAEFNDRTGFSEMIFYETDPEILQGIEDGFITAVSINGGAARSYKIINDKGQEIENPEIHCSTGECFRVGEGIILGEKDDIAFTWVVTKPGWRYNGRTVPHTVPGVKTTKIFVLQ